MHALVLRALVCIVATAITGCATQPVLRPPSTNLRERIGNITIVTLSDSSRIRYQVPDSKADIAAEKHGFEFVTPAMVVEKAGRGSSGLEAAVVGALALTAPILTTSGAPLYSELHRAYGIVVSDSAADVAAARSTMEAATARVRFKDQLREQLANTLNQNVPDTRTVPLRRDADTVLELMVYEPNISGREGINPKLGLSLGVRVRLLNARTGSELYYDYLDYRGSKHTLVDWAAQDARLFQSELQKCISHLSDEIIAQLFSRASEDAADRAALAALGIDRRPPTGISPGNSPLWSPPHTRGTLARK